MCSIGEVYRTQSKFVEAMDYYNRSLDINLRVHGPEHLETAKTQGNIAVILAQQRKHTEALEMWEKELAVKEKVLGLEHLDVATTKNEYADHYCLHFLAQCLCFFAASVQCTMIKASMMMRSQHGKMCFKFKKKHSAWSTRT